MVDPLYVNTDGVLGMARVHDAVAAQLGQLKDGAGVGTTAGPGTTHGLIAFGMNSALGGVLDRRGDVLQSAGAAGQQLSEQLHRAAEAYRSGDEQGAQGLTAAAEGMPGSGGGGAGAAVPGSPAAGIGGGGGSGDLGQTLSQVGQQAGQIAQSIAQPIQGAAQALGQIPQQVVQGLSGVLGGLAGGLSGTDGGGFGVGAGHAAASSPGGLSDPAAGTHTIGGQDNSDIDGRDREHDPGSDARPRDPDRHDKGDDDDRILTVDRRGEAGQPDTMAESATGLADGTAPPIRRPAQTRPQDV